MPTIITYPNTRRANPLNCLNICLEGTDEEFVADAGTFATATITLAGDATTPIEDEIIEIAGFVFTFKDNVNGGFNSSEIEINGDQSIMRDRIISAIGINFNFIEVEVAEISAPTIGFTLTWCEKRIQPNFVFDFATYTGATVVFSNGTNFVLNNKRLLYQLFCVVNGGKDIPICEDPQNPQVQTLDCEIIPNCFNIGGELDDVLRTTKPSFNSASFYDETIKKTFYLRYGTVEYIDEQKEKDLWRYGYPEGQGENATIVNDVQFNGVIIPLGGYPYVVTTAVSLDETHPLAVDLKAWLIGQGYTVDLVGVVYNSNSNYFSMTMIICDFDATQLTFTTNATTPSGEWEKRSTEFILTCASKFGDYLKANEFEVLNSYHLNDDPEQFAQYTNGIGGNKFLTNIPSGQAICCDTYRWLWLCLPKGIDTPIFVTLKTYDENGNPTEDDIAIPSNTSTNNVLVIPVGTANLKEIYPAIDFSNICSYTLQARTIDPGPAPTNLSEEYEIKIKKSDCCCDVQIYYKTDAGGYDTLCFEKIQSIDFESEQTEICLDVKCGTNLVEDGKAMVLGNLKQNITLTTKQFQKTREQRDIFAQFKKSNSRIIKVQDIQRNEIMRSFIVEAGGVRIFEAGEKLTVSVVGYYEEANATNEF